MGRMYAFMLVLLSLVTGGDSKLPAAAQIIAVALELADPRELPVTLAELHERAKALANAPPLSDHIRFPPRSVASTYCALNREWVRTVEQIAAITMIDHCAVIEGKLEADRLYDVWDAVRDAAGEHCIVTYRRAALARLRDLIGHENYAAGLLPPPVPLHRVQQVGRP